VRDDPAAQLFEVTLRRAGVDVSLERVDEATGVVVAVVDVTGQRAMMTDRGANSKLRLEHVLDILEGPFDHLHVSGYTLLDPLTADVGRGALARANELGCSTSSMSVPSHRSSRQRRQSSWRSPVERAMLFANEEEAVALSGGVDVDDAIDRLSREFIEVIVTRGEHGARARRDGVDYDVTTLSDEVVDTTGAGDAATGAYLAVRLRQGSVDEALEAAMSAASTRRQGTRFARPIAPIGFPVSGARTRPIRPATTAIVTRYANIERISVEIGTE